MKTFLLSLTLLVSNFATARDYLCSPYDIVGTAVYKVGFDDTAGFVGFFSRNGVRYPWGRGRCEQHTSDIVRCYPNELKSTYVDISGDAGNYSVRVSYEEKGAATLVCH